MTIQSAKRIAIVPTARFVQVEPTEECMDALEQLCDEIITRDDGAKMIRHRFMNCVYSDPAEMPPEITVHNGYIGQLYIEYVYDNSWVKARGDGLDLEWNPWVPLKFGDWVVHLGRNEFEVLPDEAFRSRYTLTETETETGSTS
ncbi:MAG: hypothetical protein ACK4UY_03990 [Dietzia sp.]